MKKVMMWLTGFTMLLLVSGCGYFSQFDNFENSAKLRVGMSSEQVKAIMGEPIDATFSKPDVWYYYVETRWHDGQMTIDECMPVVFKDGKVIGWGNEYYNKEQLLNTKYERPEIEGLK